MHMVRYNFVNPNQHLTSSAIFSLPRSDAPLSRAHAELPLHLRFIIRFMGT